MPNIFSCSADWFKKLKDEQEKVVIATYQDSGGDKVNEWLEKLQKLEEEGVPVFVVDCDSCPKIAESIGVKEVGETIVLAHGVEKGRVSPGEDIEGNLNKVKELTA